MKYQIVRTSQFKKDFKLAKKRGYKTDRLEAVIRILSEGTALPPECKDHPLWGNYSGFRECHIAPDWLLVYKLTEELLVLTLVRTGTHSDLY